MMEYYTLFVLVDAVFMALGFLAILLCMAEGARH